MSCIYDALFVSLIRHIFFNPPLPTSRSYQYASKWLQYTALCSLSGSWDWIKNLLSFVPNADSKIVQLDLFFSFIFILKSASLSLHFYRPLGQHAYMGF